MVDRSETKPLKHWLNSYIQTLGNTPVTQSHLRLAIRTNPTIQSTGERQRQAQRIATHDISSRTVNFDQNRQRNRIRPLRISSERSLTQNYEWTEAHGGTRIHEQSVPNILPRVEVSDERSARVTSVYQATSQMNQNLSESDQQDARSESSNVRFEERLACEITMSYASTTTLTEEKPSHEEVIVIQRHNTGETSLVYRGYLTKGECFSFKSQRRPTSTLSLAFYVNGSIVSETNECCEFKCTPTDSNANHQKQFLFKDIQKTNPCEKCRKDNADKLLVNNDKNTLLVRKNKNPNQSKNILKPSSTVKVPSDKHQQHKKVKPKPTEVSHPETTVNSNPSQPIKSSESTTIESISVAPTIPSTEGKSDDNPQDSNGTETVTLNGIELNTQQIMQILASMGLRTQQQQSSKGKRHPKSVENFCYIIENPIPISNSEQQTLRGLINLGFTFDDINSKESVEFLKEIRTERIILILSKTSMEKLSKPIQDEPLLCAIYVIDSSEKNSYDSKFYRGSFPNITSLCKQLENDLKPLTNDLTSISSISADSTGLRTLNYVQALKDILLETDEKTNLKKEMIDFCREEYADNTIQLKFIDEFEKNFQLTDAVQWYLRSETFVHKMMTRAFRVLDPDILYKFRYFIQHLHRQLNSSVSTSPLTVYRTLRIRKDLFDRMKENQGGLLSFNEFLLVDKSPSTIEPSLVNTKFKLVHFEIVLGTGVSTKANEILLTLGTIFRIDKIEQIDEETFNVKVTTNDDIVKAGQLMTEDLRDAVRAPFPLVRMVKLMKQRELMSYMEYFCSMLLDDSHAMEDETTILTLGGALHSLGGHYYEQEQYDQALNHLQNCLKVYLRVLPDNHEKLTPTYNNIGSIYHKQGLNEQALEYHQKAYEIQKNLKDPDLDSVAAYVGNIASVLLKLGRYKEAIHYFERDVQIQVKLHPNGHESQIAAKYHNLGGAHYRSHQYSEALENYQKCLNIELKCHSDKNPTVAVTYHNMATALAALGRFQEAKEVVEKAIERLLKTKPEDDEDLKMNRKYLQHLEEKLWMKNLFTTT